MISEPVRDCALCPRLADFRTDNRSQFPGWFNAPVPSWGDEAPRLLIVGLAPGLRGANRTGRPFTGDYAGDLLFETLGKAGATSGTYAARPDDGLGLHGVRITNAVRCVPPQNKPVGAEITACRPFLTATIDELASVRAILVLGRIAHESLLSSFGQKRSRFPFAHGAEHALPDGRVVFDSYHCSRYNTNTGRLTPQMFEAVVFAAAERAGIGRFAT
ncbi:MAG: uracil-DNA glycosylase [Hyphomicrobiaceae bacterium]|nr:uracil-DNA glycosylase [Hyphomicrobiaceae bacterium]